MKTGIPQWCLPGGRTECITAASRLGLYGIHVDLGSHTDGYSLCQEAAHKMKIPALTIPASEAISFRQKRIMKEP